MNEEILSLHNLKEKMTQVKEYEKLENAHFQHHTNLNAVKMLLWTRHTKWNKIVLLKYKTSCTACFAVIPNPTWKKLYWPFVLNRVGVDVSFRDFRDRNMVAICNIYSTDFLKGGKYNVSTLLLILFTVSDIFVQTYYFIMIIEAYHVVTVFLTVKLLTKLLKRVMSQWQPAAGYLHTYWHLWAPPDILYYTTIVPHIIYDWVGAAGATLDNTV